MVFRCSPMVGKPHHFTALVEPVDGSPLPPVSPVPACLEHPDSLTVRNGLYGISGGKSRQLYRCYPDPTNKTAYHSFTPKLSRQHVCEGTEVCGVCEETRGIHHGDTTVARGYEWTTNDVAEGLRKLALGQSYAMVSREAIRATNRHRTRSDRGEGEGKKYHGARLSRNAWQIASGWAEVFAPVLYEHVETAMRTAERAPSTDGLPKVLLLDDIPVNRASETGAKMVRDWYVLAASQIEYTPAVNGNGNGGRLVKLRCVRASATNNTIAWRLLLDELDYTPDFVVADAGVGLQGAIRAHYPKTTVLVPSLFHVRQAVTDALWKKTPGARKDGALHPALTGHLVGLRRYELSGMNPQGWGLWWDNLDALLIALSLPCEPVRRLRVRYEPLIRDILPVMAEHPEVPWSTGGFEVALRQKIKPFLAGRGHAFANVERTNRLFDLAVCHDHGLFDDMTQVVGLLRADNEQHYGWATPQRAVADTQLVVGVTIDGVPITQPYSSLRDQLILTARAKKAGIA